jgi:uncharacterized membrane protein
MDYLIVGVVVFCCIGIPLILRAVMGRKGANKKEQGDETS